MGHTKAPWIVAENTKTFVYAVDFDGERNRFDLNVYGQRGVPVEELHANARLIAAAPELLEALKAIRPYLQASEALIADAAIAKAIGEK